jgi:hypothetical protein
MMMKNNEIELNIAQITTIHKTSKKVLILKEHECVKTIVLEWARGAGKSTTWLVCKRSCKANATRNRCSCG